MCCSIVIKRDFQKLPDTIFVWKGEKRHLCAHYLFSKILGAKAAKTRKNYRDSGFNGKLPKPKMSLFS